MTYIRCQWQTVKYLTFPGGYQTHDRCENNGEYVTVYGCLAQHIHEKIFCIHHFNEWEMEVYDNKAHCHQPYCGQFIEQWEKIHVKQLTVHFALMLAQR